MILYACTLHVNEDRHVQSGGSIWFQSPAASFSLSSSEPHSLDQPRAVQDAKMAGKIYTTFIVSIIYIYIYISYIIYIYI